MFDHVEIHVSDHAASRAFYGEALGLPTVDGELVEWGDFGIVAVDDDHPLTRKLHVAFGVEDRDAVEAWWNRMTGAGYDSDGDPGPRPQYSPSYYGAFVLDPDGNSVEAVHHDGSRAGEIDHLWLRTSDVAAAKRFYETVAPLVGITIGHDSPERVRFTDGRGSFSFVEGIATEHVHFAFGVADVDAVVRFHEVALAAGYRDNGAPGERPQYHPGYYAAFVFDADGHNVEAVFHDRS
ncbi:MAG TPA: VOC family protein [Gaiellaceae bacterium]|jgi:catechol 2,3-dioxygenase-like lactoylglutathione lyase family enzyme